MKFYKIECFSLSWRFFFYKNKHVIHQKFKNIHHETKLHEFSLQWISVECIIRNYSLLLLLGVRKIIRVKIKKSTLFFKISIALMALRIRKKIIPSHFLWLPCSTKNFILKFKWLIICQLGDIFESCVTS